VLRRAMSDSQGKVAILTLLLNPTDEHRQFHLPAPHLPTRILLDSAAVDLDERDVLGDEMPAAAHSAVLLYAEYEKPTA